MYTKEEATKERVANYVAALEHEKAGYVAKVEAAKVTGEKDKQDLYAGRIKQVEDEIARAKADAEAAPEAGGD